MTRRSLPANLSHDSASRLVFTRQSNQPLTINPHDFRRMKTARCEQMVHGAPYVCSFTNGYLCAGFSLGFQPIAMFAQGAMQRKLSPVQEVNTRMQQLWMF